MKRFKGSFSPKSTPIERKSEPLVRVVADTNIVVSGLLWQGAPCRVLRAAESGTIRLFSSLILLAELEDVLKREKLSRKLAEAAVAPSAMAERFRSGSCS
jgi:predicted nucleic acid-binding protein